VADLIVKCPITGEDVFPEIGNQIMLGGEPMIVFCPSCGRRHQWIALTSRLVDVDRAPRPKNTKGS
jgi:hypothetical protein